MTQDLHHEPVTAGATVKTYFITGLVILLPLALTFAIVTFIFNLLTEPFVGIVRTVLDHYNLLENGFLFLSAEQVQKYFSQLVIVVLLFFCTVGLGVLARWFFIHWLLRMWDHVVARIPFIRSVYKTCQDVIETLFKSSGNSFKQVVLAPFPSANGMTIGLVTKDNIQTSDSSLDPLIAIFVPTTPNPTSGFLLFFKKSELVYLDMKVEDALKLVISCGTISTPIKIKHNL